MTTIHMSEAEVAQDLHALLTQLQQGLEVVIEQDHRAIAVLRSSVPAPPGRLLSESIALAKAYEKKLGYAPIPDADFARDVQDGIDAHREPIRNLWDE